MECKCYIKRETSPLPPIIGKNETLSIVKCPLCKAAPKLYEALKKLHGVFFNDLKTAYSPKQNEALSKAFAALAEAESEQ